MAPSRTARLVQPSVLAWYPSATSAALLISLPTLMRNTATASLPMKPTKEATATAHRNSRGWGLMRRSTAWYPATTALNRMMRTTTTPAKSSTLPYPNVKRLLTPRRVSAKAIPRGMAVAASPKLWMVSESRATLPESNTTTSCKRAVAISPTKDHLMAHIPRSEVAMVGSTDPWVCSCPPCPWSWLCSSSCLCARVTAAILPRPGQCARVRRRRVLRSSHAGFSRSLGGARRVHGGVFRHAGAFVGRRWRWFRLRHAITNLRRVHRRITLARSCSGPPGCLRHTRESAKVSRYRRGVEHRAHAKGVPKGRGRGRRGGAPVEHARVPAGRLDLDDSPRVIGVYAKLSLAPGSPAAHRRCERAGVGRRGPRLRLRRREEGRWAGRAHDNGQPGAPRLVLQGQVRDGLQGANLQRRARAHLVAGRDRGRARRRRVRDLRFLLPRGAPGEGRRRLQGRPARVLHHPAGHRDPDDL